MKAEYTEVKCPYKIVSKSDGREYQCNRICVKVKAGSSGEAWCRFCRKSFDFEVSEQSKGKVYGTT